MRNKLLSVTVLMSAWAGYSQVGIGTRKPNPSSQLEIVAKDKGILIPQVALKGSTDTTTIKSGNVSSLLVFNTAHTADLTPGYYYWSDPFWVRVLDSKNMDDLAKDTKNVSLEVVGQELILTDTNADQVRLDINALNKVTTLEDQGSGVFRYTNELGVQTTIDIAKKVKIAETLTVLNYDATRNTLSYLDERGKTHSLDLSTLANTPETLTVLDYDANSHQLSYKDESNVSHTLDLSTLANTPETLTVLDYDANSHQLSYKDESNNTHELDLSTLANTPETLTVLDYDAQTHQLSYKDESNVSYTLDLSTLANTPETLTVLDYDSNSHQLSYKDESKVSHTLDLSTLANTPETLTALDYDANSHQLSYKDESNVSHTLDLSTLANTPETLTVLDYDANSHKLSYKDESNNIHELDLSALENQPDVITKLEYHPDSSSLTYLDEANTSHRISLKDLVNDPESITKLDFDTQTNTLIYLDENKVKHTINLSHLVNVSQSVTTMVKNENGTYTYFNESEVDDSGQIKPGATGITIDPKSVSVRYNSQTQLFEFLDSDSKVIGTIAVAADYIQNSKSISGDAILEIGNGIGATLKDVSISIKPGKPGYVMISKDGKAQWVDINDALPKTRNELTLIDGNTLRSTVNGQVSKTDLIRGIGAYWDDHYVGLKINGVDSGLMDIMYPVQSSQLKYYFEPHENEFISIRTHYTNSRSKNIYLRFHPEKLEFDGDVTRTINSTYLRNIQGKPLDADDPRDGQVLYFNGITWRPRNIQITSSQISDSESLRTDGIIVMEHEDGDTTYLDKAMLIDTKLSIKDESITTTQIKDGTITVKDLAQNQKDKVLTTDPEGNPIWSDVSELVVEPWQVAGTTQQASENTQDIYQMGHIGLGTQTPKAALHVENQLSLSSKELEGKVLSDGNAVGSYLKTDLKLENSNSINFVNSKKDLTLQQGGTSMVQVLKNQHNTLNLEQGSPYIGQVMGSYNIFNDRSGTNYTADGNSRQYAGYFQNNQYAGRNIRMLINGMYSGVRISPLDAKDFTLSGYGYASQSVAEANAEHANIKVTGIRAYNGYTNVFTNNQKRFDSDEILGGFFTTRVFPYAGGHVQSNNVAGAYGELQLGGTGTMNFANVSGLTSVVAINGTNPKNISKLYGLRIEKRNEGSVDAKESYGVYVPYFHFRGSDTNKAWNMYSDGVTSKNYFAGKVGIGQLNPTNSLHVKATSDPVRIEGLTQGSSGDKLVVVDPSGVLKTMQLARVQSQSNANLFFPLSMEFPIQKQAINDPSLITEQEGVFTVNLHQLYANAMGMKNTATSVSNNDTTTNLPVLKPEQLDYYIPYFDNSIFSQVSITNQGMLSYRVVSVDQDLKRALLQVVFAVKP